MLNFLDVVFAGFEVDLIVAVSTYNILRWWVGMIGRDGLKGRLEGTVGRDDYKGRLEGTTGRDNWKGQLEGTTGRDN